MLLFVIPAIYLFTIMLRFSKETFISILRGHPEKLDLTTVDGSGQFVAAMTNLIGTALLGYASLLPLLFAGFLVRRHLQRTSLVRRLFLALVHKCRLYCLVPASLAILPIQEIEDRGLSIVFLENCGTFTHFHSRSVLSQVHTPHHPTYHLDPGVVSLWFPVAGSICPITLGGLSHGRRFSVRVSHLLGGFGACHYLNVSPFVSPPKNREVERGSEESRVLLLKL